MIWDIVGPLIAIAISIIFTIWHSRKLRNEALKQASHEQYLREAEQWANRIIDLCNLIKKLMIGTDFTNILTKRLDLKEIGERLCFVNPSGDALSGAISKTTSFLSSLPDKRQWNGNEVKTLREYVNEVKIIVSTFRYGPKDIISTLRHSGGTGTK